MKCEISSGIVCFILIAGRKKKDAILSALLDMGACLTNTVYGRGTVEASYIQDVLGLVPETQKVTIMCVFPEHKVDAVMEMLVSRFRFNEPNTGIAFTIPIDHLSF